MKAGVVPNEVTDQDFDRLKRYFSDDEITEIVAVIAMFGFLNRWNTTLETSLEPVPMKSVEALLDKTRSNIAARFACSDACRSSDHV